LQELFHGSPKVIIYTGLFVITSDYRRKFMRNDSNFLKGSGNNSS